MITDVFWLCDTMKVEMASYSNNSYGIMNCFAEFEKFLPHSIIMPSFRTVRIQMPELDGGRAFLPAPMQIRSSKYPIHFRVKDKQTTQDGIIPKWLLLKLEVVELT